MTLREVYLCDTNILLRLGLHYRMGDALIQNAVRELLRSGADLCYSFQNVTEFWNVCTRPSRQNGYGLSVAEVKSGLESFEQIMHLMPEQPDTYYRWRELVLSHQVQGVQVHDARLVATMQSHGISRILTLNGTDFKRYPGITAVHPSEIL